MQYNTKISDLKDRGYGGGLQTFHVKDERDFITRYAATLSHRSAYCYQLRHEVAGRHFFTSHIMEEKDGVLTVNLPKRVKNRHYLIGRSLETKDGVFGFVKRRMVLVSEEGSSNPSAYTKCLLSGKIIHTNDALGVSWVSKNLPLQKITK